MDYCPKCAAEVESEGLCAKCAAEARGGNPRPNRFIGCLASILLLASASEAVYSLLHSTLRGLAKGLLGMGVILLLAFGLQRIGSRLLRRLPGPVQEFVTADAPPRPWYVHVGIVVGIIVLVVVFSRPAVLSFLFPRYFAPWR